MRLLAPASAAKSLLVMAAAALFALTATPSRAQDDPPAQAARLSFISGAVSVQPAGIDNWGQAYPNLPLGPGDRVFTDSDGRAEIQIGESYLRIGPNSDVSFIDSTPYNIIFGVAQGSVHVHSFGFWQGQSLIVRTPSGSSSLASAGEQRVDVYPDQEATLFSVFGTDLMITGAGGFSQDAPPGQALELVGSNPVVPQWLQGSNWDDLDKWSRARDIQIENAVSYQYVSREIPGAAELDSNGEWMGGTEFGAIWFPHNVPTGWAPYHYGHWVNHAPWGWVWVEDESWGYAPFHYGRWVVYHGRWGWIPGNPTVHPVWSPALVVFAGGIHIGGGGVSVWFPLGPGEPYRPWYPCSPRYIDQVNITNIRESSSIHIQTTYVNVVNVTNVVYVNRVVGVSAMSHEDFAAGRPAAQVSVKIDVNLMEHVTPLARPEPQPTAASFVGRPPARAVPVKTERPALINAQGKLVVSKPGAKPMEAPVKPVPTPKPLPGRTVVAPPPGAKGTPAAPAKLEAKPAPPAGKPGAVPPAKPEEKPAPPAGKPAAVPAAKPEEKPAPPAAKPEEKPAPMASKPGEKPVPPPAVKPAPAPAVKPAPPATAKPVPPPAGAKSDKDKKTDKDKDKDKKDDKKPE